jgi:hypothetical protein
MQLSKLPNDTAYQAIGSRNTSMETEPDQAERIQNPNARLG